MAIRRVPEPRSAAKGGGRNWFTIVMILAAGAILLSQLNSEKSNVTKPAEPVQYAQVDKSPATEAKRAKLIQDLLNQGVFTKVEMPGNLPRVWVGPIFYTLDFDVKQSFASVVYAQYFDGKGLTDVVRLYDSKSGKEIGQYSAAAGGLKLF